MNYALMFILKLLAGIIGIILLLISLLLAIIAEILCIPYRFVSLIGNLVFYMGNSLIKWLIDCNLKTKLAKLQAKK